MKTVNGLSLLAVKMLSELRRFAFVTNNDNEDFDPIFVASTLLNPAYKKLLSDDQVEKAKSLLSMIREDNKSNENNEECDISTQMKHRKMRWKNLH
jgi:hypothetical protein